MRNLGFQWCSQQQNGHRYGMSISPGISVNFGLMFFLGTFNVEFSNAGTTCLTRAG